MPADPSTIPASATVTNLLPEPLKVFGLPAFTAGEVRVITMSAFLLAQRSVIWNALYNAVLKNLVSSPQVTFDVGEIATGQQGVVNRGGHGVGGAVVPVPGGLSLPPSVTFINLLSEPLVLAGIYSAPASGPSPFDVDVLLYGDTVQDYGDDVTLFGQPSYVITIDLTLLPINQQAAVWNALINARDKGLISSPELTTAVQTGFTGHQGVDNYGGHGNGGQISFLLQTPYVGVSIGGVPITVRGEDITVQGL
jgi:hypothetical protein